MKPNKPTKGKVKKINDKSRAIRDLRKVIREQQDSLEFYESAGMNSSYRNGIHFLWGLQKALLILLFPEENDPNQR